VTTTCYVDCILPHAAKLSDGHVMPAFATLMCNLETLRYHDCYQRGDGMWVHTWHAERCDGQGK